MITLLTFADFMKEQGAMANRCFMTYQASVDPEPSGWCQDLRFCPHVALTLWGEKCEAKRPSRVGTFRWGGRPLPCVQG